MSCDVPRGDPGWSLDGLTERVPGVRGAVLLSADGLMIDEHGLGRDAADQLAPLASGLCSIARAVGVRHGGDGLRLVMAEFDAALLLVSPAGQDSVLAMLADQTVDAGTLGYEMGQLAKNIAPSLTAQPRTGGGAKRARVPAELPRRMTRPEPC